MQISSPRFKALAVTAGLTFWFFIISNSLSLFSVEAILLFCSILGVSTQIFSNKISKALEMIAVFNTKIFLGILFVFVISTYGIFFKILRIDLLRLKKQRETYWLDMEKNNNQRIRKQY
tara:strand:- start:281 stop:637 length:357 start_codon:yes stop_codon:yes gene_type:complete